MKEFFAVVFVLIGIALGCLLLAFPFMWMWNFAVIQAISVANPISYWPAFWLMMFLTWFVAASRTSYSSK